MTTTKEEIYIDKYGNLARLHHRTEFPTFVGDKIYNSVWVLCCKEQQGEGRRYYNGLFDSREDAVKQLKSMSDCTFKAA